MRDNALWGSIALVCLILSWQAAIFFLNHINRVVPYADKDGETVAVEWVANGKKQGIFYVSPEETVDVFLARLSFRGNAGETGHVEEGMSIHTGKNSRVSLGEMEPATKLALSILLNIHSLTPAQLTLVPGIGPKTADKIYFFLKEEGCIHNLDELALISGIKGKRIAAMRQYLMVKKGECKKTISDWTSRQKITAKKMTKTKTEKIRDRLRDINTLTPMELTLVPGIGEKTADKIHSFIKRRGCIQDLDELSAISGIKEGRIANMRKYLFVTPEHCRKISDNGVIDNAPPAKTVEEDQGEKTQEQESTD